MSTRAAAFRGATPCYEDTDDSPSETNIPSKGPFHDIEAFSNHYRSTVAKRSTSPDTIEEKVLFYSNASSNGMWFFKLLNRSHPDRVRLRIERLYWEHWHSLSLAVTLSVMGSLLAGLSFYFIAVVGKAEYERGFAMLLVALVPGLPGFYILFIIFMYLRCCKGYSLAMLP